MTRPGQPANETVAVRQYATFWLGDHLYGTDVANVQEVLREQPLTPVPLAPRTIAGLLNLRGQVVTTIDLRERLQLPGPATEHPMLVVLTVDGEPVALLVDRIGAVLNVTTEQFEPPPDTLTGPNRGVVTGAYKLPDHLLLVLDVTACTTL